MDPKSIKSNLKLAKEAFKDKDIEKAIKLCNAILNEEPNNYMAYVLLGASLQESKVKYEALTAFRKAIEISPDQILAWQGLASYYEKEDAHQFYFELFSIYKRLILIEKDSKKLKEYCEKISLLLKETDRTDEFIDLYEICLDDKEISSIILNIFYQHFLSLPDVYGKYLDTFKKVLSLKIETSVENPDQQCLCQYLYVLHKSHDYETFFKTVENIQDNENNTVQLIQLICENSLEVLITQEFESSTLDLLNKYCKLLLSKHQNSFIGNLVIAFTLFYERNFIECKEKLNNISFAGRDIDNWKYWYLLSEVNIQVHCFEDAANGFIKVKFEICSYDLNKFKNKVELLLLEALSKSQDKNKCEQCYNLCTQMLSDNRKNERVLKFLIRASIELEKWEEVESYLSEIEINGVKRDVDVGYLKALYNFRTKNFEKCADLLRENIFEDLVFIEYWLLLGELNLKLNDSINALDCYLKAAELAPYNYSAFVHLGDYYRNVSFDFHKAKICYERAFQINPHSDTTGACLSDIYRKLGCKESNLEMLNAVISSNRAKWAYLRLGLYFMDIGNFKSAINYMRSAVRMDSSDSYCWECLGDASFLKGSYIVALKCYQKCLELNPTSFYAKLQTALVKEHTGLLGESIEEYRVLIKENTDYIPTLNGLAKACFKQAKELIQKQILGTARDLCEEAVNALSVVFQQNTKLICTWKLFGDICVLICHLPTKISYLSIRSSFLKNVFQDCNTNEEFVSVSRKELFDISLKSYSTAINLSTENKSILSYLWHDFSFCYNLQASTCNEEKKKLRKYALAAAKKSVSLNPKVWNHWNLLGVISLSKEINNLALAQHCFIKSIQLENNAISWSNLGTLYLKQSEIQLANEAFMGAQRADPKYARSWIGQALIAELVDHVETADLFYHATMLGYHPESVKAFSEWICKIIKNWEKYKSNNHCYYLVKKMFALQMAQTMLSWYVVYNPDESYATNLFGVLLELTGLNRSAVSMYKNALDKVDCKNKDIVLSNLGRQLRKVNRYDESVSVYQQIKEMDFTSQCDLALASFLAGKFDEALNHYESAIHWFAPDDAAAAQVMVATAALNYVAGKNEEAQTILFQCIQIKPAPIFGLFAACAFGFLNSQLKLTKLVLRELDTFKHEAVYIQHIALFNTYFETFRGAPKKAISTLSKFIFKYPGDAALWSSLCMLLLYLIDSPGNEFKVLSEAAAYHAKCAITLGKSVIDISKLCSAVSLSYLYAGKVNESLRNAMKGVFTYPNVVENWAVLIAVEYCRGVNYHFLKNTIRYVRCNFNCSKDLDTWLINIEDKLTNRL